MIRPISLYYLEAYKRGQTNKSKLVLNKDLKGGKGIHCGGKNNIFLDFLIFDADSSSEIHLTPQS